MTKNTALYTLAVENKDIKHINGKLSSSTDIHYFGKFLEDENQYHMNDIQIHLASSDTAVLTNNTPRTLDDFYLMVDGKVKYVDLDNGAPITPFSKNEIELSINDIKDIDWLEVSPLFSPILFQAGFNNCASKGDDERCFEKPDKTQSLVFDRLFQYYKSALNKTDSYQVFYNSFIVLHADCTIPGKRHPKLLCALDINDPDEVDEYVTQRWLHMTRSQDRRVKTEHYMRNINAEGVGGGEDWAVRGGWGHLSLKTDIFPQLVNDAAFLRASHINIGFHELMHGLGFSAHAHGMTYGYANVLGDYVENEIVNSTNTFMTPAPGQVPKNIITFDRDFDWQGNSARWNVYLHSQELESGELELFAVSENSGISLLQMDEGHYRLEVKQPMSDIQLHLRSSVDRNLASAVISFDDMFEPITTSKVNYVFPEFEPEFRQSDYSKLTFWEARRYCKEHFKGYSLASIEQLEELHRVFGHINNVKDPFDGSQLKLSYLSTTEPQAWKAYTAELGDTFVKSEINVTTDLTFGDGNYGLVCAKDH
ncbi:hypothetical protein AYK60_08460 [Vibrio sp. SBT000027]|nr:hypothetical protein AYK60_08460 [Vibrio sp. SBT000027]